MQRSCLLRAPLLGPRLAQPARNERGPAAAAGGFTARARRCSASLRQEQAPTPSARSTTSSSSSGGGSTAAQEGPLTALSQRLLAACPPGGDSRLVLLAAALLGAAALAAPGPAAAAAAAHDAHAAAGAAVPHQLLGDLAEGEDFWSNVLRYISYFFSVLLGTAYVALKPLVDLFKRPATAILALGGIAGLLAFVSFTVNAMLGVSEPFEYSP